MWKLGIGVAILGIGFAYRKTAYGFMDESDFEPVPKPKRKYKKRKTKTPNDTIRETIAAMGQRVECVRVDCPDGLSYYETVICDA